MTSTGLDAALQLVLKLGLTVKEQIVLTALWYDAVTSSIKSPYLWRDVDHPLKPGLFYTAIYPNELRETIDDIKEVNRITRRNKYGFYYVIEHSMKTGSVEAALGKLESAGLAHSLRFGSDATFIITREGAELAANLNENSEIAERAREAK